MIRLGIISEVKPGYAKVYFDDDGIVSDWLPVIVRKSKTDKESWPLEVNEHVVCLMVEHFETWVIGGAIPNEEDTPDPGEGAGKFRKLFSDGTILEYDKTAGKLTADVKGDVVLKAQGSATVEAAVIGCKATASAEIEAPVITLKGSVIVQGTITATGAISGASIATTGGGSITASGDMNVEGSITATGDLTAAGKSLLNHVHIGVLAGGDNSGPPL